MNAVDTALWATAGLLAAVFLASGVAKLVVPRERLIASGLAVLEGFSDRTVRLIGTLEVLAAIGLILPALLGIAAVLVPTAALGVVLLMLGAMTAHARRRELQAVAATFALLATASFVAWGRFALEPLS